MQAAAQRPGAREPSGSSPGPESGARVWGPSSGRQTGSTGTLVVWRLDRLARSLKQLIETVEQLEARGIGFRCLNESIDTTTSGGRLVFHIFASLAEFERSIIRERTKAGLQAAIARGRKGGRPPALSAADRAAALALLGDPTIPIREVARRLGCSEATLYRHFPGGRTGLQEAQQ